MEDGVDVYIFNHEPYAVEIDVEYGGNVGRTHRYGGGLTAVEIELTAPLRSGEITSFEYRTVFQEDTTTDEVRRAAFARAEHVDLAVQFAGSRRPRKARWCVWDDHLAERTLREFPISVQGSYIRRHLPFIEQTVVGFRWIW
ncbi:hypothetical protein [Symbioplanes lichenis]|uniref:hypothetical protein n=1 Tax=Symbioplanes lichenis TaxID=1629072 RepID=UPI0027391047|nr:hypothetical protein [Actinoplanes lichenis]